MGLISRVSSRTYRFETSGKMAAFLEHLKNCGSAQAWKDCEYSKVLFEFFGAFGLIYALLYTKYRANGADAHFNPAVTTAEIMCGRTSTWHGMLYMLMQCLGAKVGLSFSNWLLGSSLDAVTADNLASTFVSEFFAVAALVWIWSLVHSEACGSHWKEEFIGFGVGIAYYVSSLLVPHGSANPAGYLARKSANWEWNYASIDFAYVVGPICASFIVSLVFQWFHKG